MTDIEQRLAAAGLRVKPLEWAQGWSDHIWFSTGEKYAIRHYTAKRFYATHHHDFFDSFESASKACDAHNATAILSSLEVIE